MKNKLFLVATATLLLASCVNEATTELAPAPEASADFTAIIANESRTELGEGNAVLWVDSDELSIFTKTAHNRHYQVKELSENKRSATFGYVGYTGSDASVISANYAVYPYDAAITLSGEVITTKIATEQVYDAEKANLANALMVAKSETTELQFVNAGALLRFKVAKEDIPDSYILQSIKVASAAHALAGEVTIDLTGDMKAVVAEDGDKEITLTGINLEVNTTPVVCYIALPATNFEADDLTVTFALTENGVAKEVVKSLPAFELAQNAIKGINYTIKYDDEFTGNTPEYTPVVGAEELLSAATAGGEITLDEDVVLTQPLTVLADLVINLNGKTITGSGLSNTAVILADGATVTIKGDGEVATESAYPLGVKNNGTLTVEGGKYTATNSTQALYVWSGMAYIKGGEFYVDSQYNGTSYVDADGNGRYVLNCLDSAYKNGSADIVVTGGTFYKFDPNNNVAEGTNTDFVPEGYKTILNGDWYYLVADTVDAVVSDSTGLSSALAAGGNIVLAGDVSSNTNISNDVNITLNGNTLEATYSFELSNNANLTMTGGDYVANGTYGHVDVRPTTAEGSEVYFEDVNFAYNKLSKTYGPSTNRLGSVVEVCATVADAKTKITFKNCTFDNAMVLFEGMSGMVSAIEAVFEGCTFNALTSSAPIYVQNYVTGTIKVVDCTFNLECTSSSASAISISQNANTAIELTAKNNTLNAVAATPYTYDASKGETEEYTVKVNGTPSSIQLISWGGTTSAVTETGTIKSGIAL